MADERNPEGPALEAARLVTATPPQGKYAEREAEGGEEADSAPRAVHGVGRVPIEERFEEITPRVGPLDRALGSILGCEIRERVEREVQDADDAARYGGQADPALRCRGRSHMRRLRPVISGVKPASATAVPPDS